MQRFLLTLACLAFSVPGLAQTADEPAAKDDVVLYLRTMHSPDMFRRIMEVQSQNTQQMFRDQLLQEKGSILPEFEAHFKKAMEDLIKGMPIDEVTQAMIPAYQKHFTKSDLEAMNTFYPSAVGQKVLQQLPAVTQEGSQAAMPILGRYVSEWKERRQQDLQEMEKDFPKQNQQAAPSRNRASRPVAPTPPP